MQIECGLCKTAMEMPDPKPPQIINSAGVSVIVLEHPEQAVCASCGRTVAVFVQGVTFLTAAIPVQAKAQQRLVIAPHRSPMRT